MDPRALALALLMLGCGGSDEDGPAGASGGAAGSSSGGAAGSSSGGAAGSSSGGAAGSSSGGAAGSSSGGSGGGTVADPSLPGPNSTTPFAAVATVAATKHQVPMHCLVPVGPSSKAAPVVLIAHGFQLAAKQYYGYAERLATHGFIACTADFPADFQANHAANAQDISGALDWVLVQSTTGGSPLQGKVDINQIGVMGHSLGGKVSVLVAKADTRFKALLGLDPVDSATGCDATKCPDASDQLPLPIPTAFLGETLDATGTFQACAPAPDNYQTFFAKAAAPSIEVTLNGASHMSFIDDVASCGLPCTFCKQATMPAAAALSIARSYSVAFFARHLRAQVGYDAWLSGDLAKQKWGNEISLQSK